jgi:hypothetical protein
MSRVTAGLFAFNRGCISPLALARTDIERLRLSAETQTNFMPRTIGPMMLRPGLGYVGETYNSAKCVILPFIAGTDDAAIMEFTPNTLRIWESDALVTRVAVGTTITSSAFSASTGWTDADTGAGVSTISGGFLNLTGAIGGSAKRKQTITVALADRGVRHAVRVVVTRGPVLFRIGSTDGDDDVLTEATLDDGTHSLAFTPTTANVYLEIENRAEPVKIVDSCTIESAGVMTLPTPYGAGALATLRITQSADVIFIAASGKQQQKVERRATDSWSVVTYKTDDGPFRLNISTTKLTPSGLSGNITLSSDNPLFKAGHVGSIFRLYHSGQDVDSTISAEDTYSNTIRVTGVSTGVHRGPEDPRQFDIDITGTWVGKLTLQRSFDGPTTGFADVSTAETWTANVSDSYSDRLDNSIIWYRIGFKPGEYTSGSAEIVLTYANGGGSGVCRVTAYTNHTTVSAEVLTPTVALTGFKNTTPTDQWYYSDWSDVQGWPSATAIHEGRLWWAGADRIWGSVSDAYASYDLDVDGDSGTINRSVGYGPIADINWLLPLSRMIIGSDSSAIGVRSSSLDEPLSPSNFTLKDCSTQGAAALPAVRIDQRGIFLQRSNRRVYELAFDIRANDFAPSDLTRLNMEIGFPGFVDVDVQRQPDTRIHFVRSDGDVAVLLYDPEDEVEAWWLMSSGGAIIENVCVLPGTLEDAVYYVVRRTVNGVLKRYIERAARIDECQGDTITKLMDGHKVFTSGSPTTTVTGADHLEGKTVTIWADGKDAGTAVVTGGSFTLATAASTVVYGIGYQGQFKSAKLAYGGQLGTALTQPKRIDHIGLLLAATHYQGIKYGQDFDTLDNLPLIEEEAATAADTIWTSYDQQMVEFEGDWDTDCRLCLQAASPRPCTVIGVSIAITTHEKV